MSMDEISLLGEVYDKPSRSSSKERKAELKKVLDNPTCFWCQTANKRHTKTCYRNEANT